MFAYTNCQELELFLNGISQGKKKIEKYGHGEWYVDYEPGTLEVKAINDDKVICTDKKVTSGNAVKLNLRLENGPVSANGSDVAIVTCYCTDIEGREVPTATPYVEFCTNNLGKIIGTGSDVCDHNPVTDTNRRMRAGRITVAVQTG